MSKWNAVCNFLTMSFDRLLKLRLRKPRLRLQMLLRRLGELLEPPKLANRFFGD